MFGAIAGGIASALAGGAMSKLFGGGQKAASGGIQGDVLATDNNTVGMGDAGIKSAIQGSNVPNPDEAVPSFVSGAMAKAGKGLLEGTLQAGTSAVSDKLLDLVGLGGKSAADKGKDTRDYLAAALPELNAWERAGADASSAGMVYAGFDNQIELAKMQLDCQKEISEMQNDTQKEIVGIQSATSRQNTKDQVYAQNEMLAYQQKESTARVASIMENTNLSKQQQVSEIMRQMLTQAQTAGQYFTNDQIKEMTRKVSAEVDLVHQQTQNQRYGSSHIGATAKDISNVVRSEERFSRNAETDLVCRLLLEKKNHTREAACSRSGEPEPIHAADGKRRPDRREDHSRDASFHGAGAGAGTRRGCPHRSLCLQP